MEISGTGIALIKNFEGARLESYQDSVGVWTIGVGHTGPVNGKPLGRGVTITQAEADALLWEDVQSAVHAVNRFVTVPLSQKQFDALVSWTFNLGAGALEESTLLKLLNEKRYVEAGAEFTKWIFAGPTPLLGLLRRRLAEAIMYAEGTS